MIALRTWSKMLRAPSHDHSGQRRVSDRSEPEKSAALGLRSQAKVHSTSNCFILN